MHFMIFNKLKKKVKAQHLSDGGLFVANGIT